MIRHRYKEGVPTPRDAITREHFVARSYGGQNGGNLVAACCLCNTMRGNIQAITFYNLQRKWFANDKTLQQRWHQISAEEMNTYRLECLKAHERHLNRRAKQSIEYAFRHLQLIRDFGYMLTKTI